MLKQAPPSLSVRKSKKARIFYIAGKKVENEPRLDSTMKRVKLNTAPVIRITKRGFLTFAEGTISL